MTKAKDEEECNESSAGLDIAGPSNRAESPVSRNGVIYGNTEDNLGETEEKIVQTIRCSFPRPLMKKMLRLFLFIVSFGSDVFHFSAKGNVVVRGKLVEPNSNILDLLVAAVSDHLSEAPTGLKVFLQALRDINVPSNFLHSVHTGRKYRNERRFSAVERWKPY
ncbi:MAG: hypothetical protein N0C90_17145 [Candidatus Thiodiazotropha endolucinida]|nr:hypothetical protein [Candidatus Thiodiazotropha taylori]MCG8044770.1 hypothetical protein [Candidatus Thiodiazotropha taylori]MCW4263083.1 hypothetical protein [Candidatus Thiodiazotropha endolucinida]